MRKISRRKVLNMTFDHEKLSFFLGLNEYGMKSDTFQACLELK